MTYNFSTPAGINRNSGRGGVDNLGLLSLRGSGRGGARTYVIMTIMNVKQ